MNFFHVGKGVKDDRINGVYVGVVLSRSIARTAGVELYYKGSGARVSTIASYSGL